MMMPVWVEQQNGKFVANVLGAPGLCADGDTRDAAIAALQSKLLLHAAMRELVFVDVEVKGLLALVGRYVDDPEGREMWQEIMTEAYRHRDEQKAQEFPE